ncbi:MAG: PspC domain-containing protein [Proteobacteria bacterium]|nr:PspC domain-containing protein [Pseudomonadota bacterium]
MIAGVCSGLAKDFSCDPFIIRILFIIFFLAGGSGILLYLILWLLMALNTQGK